MWELKFVCLLSSQYSWYVNPPVNPAACSNEISDYFTSLA